MPGTLWAYDLGSVSSGAGNSNEAIPPAESASANAPTQGSLTATEPQSVINRNYIENTQTGASTYVDNAAIAPGVWSVSPNGPGGSDQAGLVMRSFQDGQYNVTFDGTQDLREHVTPSHVTTPAACTTPRVSRRQDSPRPA